jgi:hypothetical protein
MLAEILLPSCLNRFYDVLKSTKQNQSSAICLQSGEIIISIIFGAKELTHPSRVIGRLQ